MNEASGEREAGGGSSFAVASDAAARRGGTETNFSRERDRLGNVDRRRARGGRRVEASDGRDKKRGGRFASLLERTQKPKTRREA
jgi:hypothetical protein